MQLGVRDVSKLLNVSEKTIYRWVGQGILPAYRVNEQYRFNRAELLEWATSRKMNVSAAVFDEPESNATPIPGLVEALQAGGVFYRLSGADKEGALRAVVEQRRDRFRFSGGGGRHQWGRSSRRGALRIGAGL